MGVGLKAALFLVSIHSLVLVNVTVAKGFGYGLLGLNVLGGSVYGSSFTENNLYTYNDSDCLLQAGKLCDTSRCVGGNALLVCGDYFIKECLVTTYKFEIWNSSFVHGVSVCDMPTGYLKEVGGLGVLFGQSSFGIEVDIHDVHVEGAPLGANVHIQFVDYVNDSSVILHRTYSGYGNAEYRIPVSAGGGIYIQYGIVHGLFSPVCEYNKDESTQWNSVIISQSEIVHGRAVVGAGLYFDGLSTDNPHHTFSMYMEKSLFSDNIGNNGIAVHISEYQTSPFVNPAQIMFSNTKFINNYFLVDDEDFFSKAPDTTLLGTVWALSVPYLNFNNCIFQQNELTGLAAWDSNIIFCGENNFVSNRGFNDMEEVWDCLKQYCICSHILKSILLVTLPYGVVEGFMLTVLRFI